MVLTTILLFAAALAVGVYLVLRARRGRSLPLPVGLTHGGIAIGALVALFFHVFAHPKDYLYNTAAVLFVIAALGGLFLMAFRLEKQRPPMPVILFHGAVAVVAFSLLVLGYLRA